MSEQIQIGGKKQLLRSLRNELDQMKNKLNQTLSKLENISDMDSTQSGGSSYTTETSLTESNVYSVNDLLKGGGDLEFEIISNQQGGDEISSCSSGSDGSDGSGKQGKKSQGGGEGKESSVQEGGEESSAQEGGEESSSQEGGEESSSQEGGEESSAQEGGEESSEEESSEEESSEEEGEESEESSEEESQGGGESEISMTTSDTSSLPSYINNAMRDILEDKYSKDQVSHKSGISIKDLLKNKMNI